MTAQLGRALVALKGDGADPEVFTGIAGAKNHSMTINNEPVDITNKDSAGWRELLAGAGVRNVSFSMSGVFKDDASYAAAAADALADAHSNYQFTVPDFGTYEGPFMISSLENSGEHNGEVQYSMSFDSAGPVTFTAA